MNRLARNRISGLRNSAGALEITDANDYYPFGMNHLKTGNAYFRQGSYKNNKYNGKELQETGLYSYGWREYMPDLGRWNGIDQLAETYHSTGTYAYVANNPISKTDPDGRWMDEAGNIDLSGIADPFSIMGTRSLMTKFVGRTSDEGGGGITLGNLMDALQGLQDPPSTTLNFAFQFGEWDYLYTEKQGMIKGTKGAEFASESMLDNNPYNNKYFNTNDFKKVNNVIAGLNIAITIIKLKNGEYSINTSKNPLSYDSKAYDAKSDGTANIQYIGNGKGVLNIQFQITNNKQTIETKIEKIDGSVTVKDSHTANITVSYPFKVSENRGKVSLQFGRPTDYQSYNLNTLMIAEGIRYIPLLKYEFLGPPIQTKDYNYQIKKK